MVAHALARLAGLGQNSADLLRVWPDSKSSYGTEASSPCESPQPRSPPTPPPTPSTVGAQSPISSSQQDIVGAQSLVPTRALWGIRALSYPPPPGHYGSSEPCSHQGLGRRKVFSSGLHSVCEQVSDSSSTGGWEASLYPGGKDGAQPTIVLGVGERKRWDTGATQVLRQTLDTGS